MFPTFTFTFMHGWCIQVILSFLEIHDIGIGFPSPSRWLQEAGPWKGKGGEGKEGKNG